MNYDSFVTNWLKSANQQGGRLPDFNDEYITEEANLGRFEDAVALTNNSQSNKLLGGGTYYNGQRLYEQGIGESFRNTLAKVNRDWLNGALGKGIGPVVEDYGRETMNVFNKSQAYRTLIEGASPDERQKIDDQLIKGFREGKNPEQVIGEVAPAIKAERVKAIGDKKAASRSLAMDRFAKANDPEFVASMLLNKENLALKREDMKLRQGDLRLRQADLQRMKAQDTANMIIGSAQSRVAARSY